MTLLIKRPYTGFVRPVDVRIASGPQRDPVLGVAHGPHRLATFVEGVTACICQDTVPIRRVDPLIRALASSKRLRPLIEDRLKLFACLCTVIVTLTLSGSQNGEPRADNA